MPGVSVLFHPTVRGARNFKALVLVVEHPHLVVVVLLAHLARGQEPNPMSLSNHLSHLQSGDEKLSSTGVSGDQFFAFLVAGTPRALRTRSLQGNVPIKPGNNSRR